MGNAIDRLKLKITEFEQTEMKGPTHVTLHPHAYMALRYDLQPSHTGLIAENVTPSPVMGMEIRIDASKDSDFMEVGRD